MPQSKRRPRRHGAEGSQWRRIVKFIVTRDAGRCHICLHWNASSADHLVPVTEDPARSMDVSNLKAVHGSPHPCPECSSAAGKPIYCNEIRGAMSVDRARRLIEERTGLKISAMSKPKEPEGREW